jgi:hypothetical protein
LRQALKSGPRPAPSPSTEDLRLAIKDAELLSERITLDWLESNAGGWPASSNTAADAVENNLWRVLELTTAPEFRAQAAALLAIIAGSIAGK